MERRCVKCGTILCDGANFCIACGAANPCLPAKQIIDDTLVENQPPAPAPAPVPAPYAPIGADTYVPAVAPVRFDVTPASQEPQKPQKKGFFAKLFKKDSESLDNRASAKWQNLNSPTILVGSDDSATTVRGSAGGDDSDTIVKSVNRRAALVRRSTGERFEFFLPAVVGKGSAADVRISGNGTISRQHVRLSFEGGSFFMEDLSSTNGTSVDGNPLAPGGTVVVKSGSVIGLSDEELVFYEV